MPHLCILASCGFKMVSRCMSEQLKEAFGIIYACVGLQLFVSTVGMCVCVVTKHLEGCQTEE